MRFTSTTSSLLLVSAASACPFPGGGRGNTTTTTTSSTTRAHVYPTPTIYPTFSVPATLSASGVPSVSVSGAPSFSTSGAPSFSTSGAPSFSTSGAPSFSTSGAPSFSTSGAPSSTPGTGSSVPVGQVIRSCTVPGDIALTFDDGPFNFTMKALDLLRDAGMRATFFVNGENYSKITDRGAEIARILSEGHQLGSHTWSHPFLSQLNDAAVREQMIKLEDTLVTMTGMSPTYMRPPYFDYNDNTLAAMKALGYHVIQTDVDTQDWANQTPETFNKSVENFRTGLDNGGRLVLAHDVHKTTIDLLLPEMIKIVEERGLRAVPVGECLGDSPANWYRGPRLTAPPPTVLPSGTPTNGTATSTAVPTPTGVQPTGVVGPGGACGGDQKYVCLPGNCCSQYGFCGTTAEYCGTGCQSAFGLCF